MNTIKVGMKIRHKDNQGDLYTILHIIHDRVFINSNENYIMLSDLHKYNFYEDYNKTIRKIDTPSFLIKQLWEHRQDVYNVLELIARCNNDEDYDLSLDLLPLLHERIKRFENAIKLKQQEEGN